MSAYPTLPLPRAILKRHNVTFQISGKVGSVSPLSFKLKPQAEVCQTGAVQRRHLAGRLRPVVAAIRTPSFPNTLPWCTI